MHNQNLQQDMLHIIQVGVTAEIVIITLKKDSCVAPAAIPVLDTLHVPTEDD
ncbi:hypothetical protein [Candidatus Nitrosopumilus sediminis]|uniref:hypothetical protein n=1 Tax=Candidatus Nitrosopumilus sediminis TaxID=1229909 RepID=UPI0012EA2B13|nr:hypothetical protein [Candidatus Nitrosopumilus sediminis]